MAGELTQEAIDALIAAIATGAKKISYQDRTVEYHSLEEMLLALGIIQQQVAAQENAIAEGGTSSTFAKFRRD